jgi:hypothetical protein
MKRGENSKMAVENKQLTTDEIERKIRAIQLRKLEKEEALEEDLKQQAIAVRMAASSSLRQKMEMERRIQANCDHRKENGHSRLVACRSSTGRELFGCQNCGKEFVTEDCPPHLRPKAEHIGGPIMGYAG